MTDKLREAAQAALDLLSEDDRNADKCIRILEAALAEPEQEPEQEPVGKFAKFSDGVWKEVTASSQGIFLYTAPPRKEWVSLTDEEITEIRLKMFDAVATNYETYRAIESKLREKNT